jgi:hypothetical protein
VVLLEPRLELQELLKQASGHLEARFFGVHELEGLDESPAEALHQHDQSCDAATVSSID